MPKDYRSLGHLLEPHPRAFRPERHSEGAFGIIADQNPVNVEILIRNDKTEAYLRARAIHPSQRFVKRLDGRTALTMTVRGTKELRNWVLGFGPWLKVLKPKRLRDEVAGLLRQAARNYRFS